MNKHRLQAELWETQIWLMWILAFLLIRFGGFWPHVFATIILIHSGISFIGTIIKILKAQVEAEKE